MSKGTLYTGIAVVLALAVVAYFFFFMNNPFASAPSTDVVVEPATSSNPSAQNPNSVVIQDVSVGTGAEATPGSDVSVQYVGKLQDGTVFDQSSNHGGSFTFTLGAGQVIPGWEEGIQGMKVGGERILIIPPSLAYGTRQVGPIPANSTLIFDVKLLNVATSSTSTPQ